MERPTRDHPPFLSCTRTAMTPQWQAGISLWQPPTLLPCLFRLTARQHLYLKELPPFLRTTCKAGNSGCGFLDIYSSTVNLEAVVPSFKSLSCLLNLEQPTSTIMWRSCCPCMFYHSQLSKAISGWTYRHEWISYCNLQKVYGLFFVVCRRNLYSSNVIHRQLCHPLRVNL